MSINISSQIITYDEPIICTSIDGYTFRFHADTISLQLCISGARSYEYRQAQ